MLSKKLFTKILVFISNPVTIIAIVLFAIPFFWFGGSQVVAGGESYAIINPFSEFKSSLYTWSSGAFGSSHLYFVSIIYAFINRLLAVFFSVTITHKIILGCCISLSYLSCYSLIKYVFRNHRPKYNIFAFTCLLYIFNPFFYYTLPWLPFYGFFFMLAPVAIKEAIAYIDSSDVRNLLKFFIYSILFSVVALNVSLIGIFIFILLIYAFVNCLYKKDYFNTVKKISIIIFTFLISNMFWILPLFFLRDTLFGNATIYATSFNANSIFPRPILNAIGLVEYYWFDKSNSLGVPYYQYFSWYRPISIFFFITLLATGTLILAKNRIRDIISNKLVQSSLFFSSLFFIGVFFTKGTASPIGGIYYFLLEYVPYFGMYRSSDLKFPYLILLSFVFLFSLIGFLKNRKLFIVISIIGIVLMGLPLKTPKSGATEIPSYWRELASDIDAFALEGRVLLFPKNTSVFDDYKWGFEGGNLLQMLELRSSITNTVGYGYSSQEKKTRIIGSVYADLEKGKIEDAKKLMNDFNIKYLLIRNDFDIIKNNNGTGNFEKGFSLDDASRVNDIVRNNFKKIDEKGQLELYALSNEDFVQKFYISKKTEAINSNQPSITGAENNKSLNIEFKKINPTKYRVILHRIEGSSKLVFSELFHSGWKAYLGDNKIKDMSENASLTAKVESDYKILEGGNEDQATKAEIIDYVNKGLISTLGNGKTQKINHTKRVNGREKFDYEEQYTTGFVSKNINGTIQNDNMPSGSIAETWFQKPIENDKNHFEINGYANSWAIDPTMTCENNDKCVKNEDGSYDMEVIIEYWPQRLYYLGVLISGTALISSVGWLLYIWKRKRKGMKESEKTEAKW